MTEFLIAVVPLLALVGLLVAGRYPGHRTAMRLGERIFSSAKVRPATGSALRPASPTPPTVRGGLLIAFGLAQRPPPLAH